MASGINVYLLELESIGLITSESKVNCDSDQGIVLAPSQPSWIEQFKVSAGMNYNKARKQVRNRQGESKAQSSVGSESKQIWTWEIISTSTSLDGGRVMGLA